MVPKTPAVFYDRMRRCGIGMSIVRSNRLLKILLDGIFIILAYPNRLFFATWALFQAVIVTFCLRM